MKSEQPSEHQLNKEVVELVSAISRLLAERAPEVQSVVLAELLATWVLGFYIPGNPKATKEVQAKYLAQHIELVNDLVNGLGNDVYRHMLKRN